MKRTRATSQPERTRGARLVSLDRYVRQAYIQERTMYVVRFEGRIETYCPGPRWDGGIGSGGKMYTPIWPRITDYLLYRDLNPLRMVLLLFDPRATAGSHAPAPLPSLLISDGAVTRLMTIQDDYDSLLPAKVRSEKQRLSTYIASTAVELGLETKTAWRFALMDNRAAWSPLTRYCVGCREGLDDVRDEYREAALAQYLASPQTYDQVYGDHLPEELRNVAKTLQLS